MIPEVNLKKGILVGYDVDSPAYRIYFKNEQNVECTDNVLFEEQPRNEQHIVETEVVNQNKKTEEIDENYESLEENEQEESIINQKADSIHQNLNLQNTENSQHYGLRNRRKLKIPDKYTDYDLNWCN